MSLRDTTLSTLLAEMKQRGDFPSLSTTLGKVMECMKDPQADDEKITAAVLSDFALTQKVLRLANSGMYSSFGGAVTTVSKALFILGTEAVGHLAVGLKLLDNLDKAADTSLAKRELQKAVMSGVTARHVVARTGADGAEEVAVAALMQNLGKLLVCFYLPEQFKAAEARSGAEGEAAAQAVLGMSYASVGSAVCAEWGLPAELTTVMSDQPEQGESDHTRWVRDVGRFSTTYVDAVSKGADDAALGALAQQFADAVGVSAADLKSFANASLQTEEGAQLVSSIQASGAPAVPTGSKSCAQALAAGISEMRSVASAMRPDQLTTLALEVLLTSLGCANAGFFLRLPAHKCYSLMLGLGASLPAAVKKTSFEEAFSANVFHLALANKTPVLLANTTDPAIIKRLPAWYRQSLRPCRSLFLLPVCLEGQPMGLIYLDWGDQARSAFDPIERGHLETIVREVEQSFARVARAAQRPSP